MREISDSAEGVHAEDQRTLHQPWMSRRCVAGSMSGTPLWCRSKCSPARVSMPSSRFQRRPRGAAARWCRAASECPYASL